VPVLHGVLGHIRHVIHILVDFEFISLPRAHYVQFLQLRIFANLVRVSLRMMLEDTRLPQQSVVEVVDPVALQPILDVIRHELVFDELFYERRLNIRIWPFLT